MLAIRAAVSAVRSVCRRRNQGKGTVTTGAKPSDQAVAGGGQACYGPAMAAPRKRLPTRMTLDEFLVWDADDVTDRRWQLIDGEPVLRAPAADVHGTIQAEVTGLLGESPACGRKPI